jgi:hypothetical protein
MNRTPKESPRLRKYKENYTANQLTQYVAGQAALEFERVRYRPKPKMNKNLLKDTLINVSSPPKSGFPNHRYNLVQAFQNISKGQRIPASKSVFPKKTEDGGTPQRTEKVQPKRDYAQKRTRTNC